VVYATSLGLFDGVFKLAAFVVVTLPAPAPVEVADGLKRLVIGLAAVTGFAAATGLAAEAAVVVVVVVVAAAALQAALFLLPGFEQS